MTPINEDKTLSYRRTYIIDQDFILHDDVTGKAIGNFVIVENNYYNESTNILYNSSFEEIAYIGDINPSIVEGKYFFGKLDGYYGILDSSARVCAEFIYDGFVTDIKDNCIVGIRNNNYYRINLYNGTETLIGSMYETEYDRTSDTFVVQTNSYVKVATTSTDLYTKSSLPTLSKIYI